MSDSAFGRLAGPLIYAAVFVGIGAFVYSGLKGERGLAALAAAEARGAELEGALAALTAERREAENRVRRLGRDYLDLDLLDEEARRVLGVAREGEVILRPVSR